MPELRIGGDNLEKSVCARQESMKHKPRQTGRLSDLLNCRRPKFFLSGLMFCAECGRKVVNIGTGRCACPNAKHGLGCENKAAAPQKQLEEAVLRHLKQYLLTDDRISICVDDYKAELARQQAEWDKLHEGRTSEMQKTQKKIANILSMIENGNAPASVNKRLQELENELALLSSRGISDTRPYDQSTLIEKYRAKVQDMESLLENRSFKQSAMNEFRPLIDKIVLCTKGETWRAWIYGGVATLLGSKNPDEGVLICPR
jgi:hypothetical protein